MQANDDRLVTDKQVTAQKRFENPIWVGYALAADMPRPLDANSCDIDGDESPEVVPAYRLYAGPLSRIDDGVAAAT